MRPLTRPIVPLPLRAIATATTPATARLTTATPTTALFRSLTIRSPSYSASRTESPWGTRVRREEDALLLWGQRPAAVSGRLAPIPEAGTNRRLRMKHSHVGAVRSASRNEATAPWSSPFRRQNVSFPQTGHRTALPRTSTASGSRFLNHRIRRDHLVRLNCPLGHFTRIILNLSALPVTFLAISACICYFLAHPRCLPYTRRRW